MGLIFCVLLLVNKTKEEIIKIKYLEKIINLLYYKKAIKLINES